MKKLVKIRMKDGVLAVYEVDASKARTGHEICAHGKMVACKPNGEWAHCGYARPSLEQIRASNERFERMAIQFNLVAPNRVA